MNVICISGEEREKKKGNPFPSLALGRDLRFQPLIYYPSFLEAGVAVERGEEENYNETLPWIWRE